MKRFLTLSLIIFFNNITAQTTIVLQPDALDGKDAVVWSNSANANIGAVESNTIYTWTNSGNLGVKRVFLQFDLSAIPENATILSAALSLYYNPTDPYEGFSFHTGENDLRIRRVLSPWEEQTITWNNQPAVDGLNQVTLPPSISGSQDYLNINVTDQVIDMLDPDLDGSHGFMLSMVDEENPHRGLIFASSDHTNELLHPKLEIRYLDNCPELLPLNSMIASGIYQAQNITSSGTIVSGSDVELKGAVSVKLLPGFSALPGSTFYAGIEACSDPPVETVVASPAIQIAPEARPNTDAPGQSTISIWPNPSRDAMTISYSLDRAGTVNMTVVTLAGQKVEQLIKTNRQIPGTYQLVYHPLELEPGIYVLILQLDDQQITKKIVRVD